MKRIRVLVDPSHLSIESICPLYSHHTWTFQLCKPISFLYYLSHIQLVFLQLNTFWYKALMVCAFWSFRDNLSSNQQIFIVHLLCMCQSLIDSRETILYKPADSWFLHLQHSAGDNLSLNNYTNKCTIATFDEYNKRNTLKIIKDYKRRSSLSNCSS